MVKKRAKAVEDLGRSGREIHRKTILSGFSKEFATAILEEIKKGGFERVSVENHSDSVEVKLYCTWWTGDCVVYNKDGNVTSLGVFLEDDDRVFDLLKEYEKRGIL